MESKVRLKKIALEEDNIKKSQELLDFTKVNFDTIKKDLGRSVALYKDKLSSQKTLDSSKLIFEKAESDLFTG
ncbi:MAG UNVERIFIED_CONTAM: hypothetical protein LVQ98_09620 [Rickettsiaceae bacterium]|jgi:multidrug resistance efflux pump